MKIEPGLLEHGPIYKGREKRVLSKLGDAHLIDIREEAARQQDAVLRMADASQRLGPGQTFTLEVDLGLIPDFDPVTAQRLGYCDPRPWSRAHGIHQRAPFVLGHVPDRTGPGTYVLAIGIAHARRPPPHGPNGMRQLSLTNRKAC